MFPFSRPTFESSPSAASVEAGFQRTSEILGEAIMDSVSSVRDSLPEQYRAHFETLRQEIIDFTKAHGISRESLGKPDLLREVTSKLSIQDLERFALLLERFEYLLKHKEPKEITDSLEYVEEFYHLREQYTSQVSLLEQVGILENGVITGIDGHEYPVPTFEQIAIRLFERRETLETKHDQGFIKLLLVPFGMSLDALKETFKQFLLKYKKSASSFDLNADDPLSMYKVYQGADIGNSPKLVYYPLSFTREGHGGKTKAQILKEQAEERWTPASKGVVGEKGEGTPGWTVHLLQPSNPSDSYSLGFASIPKRDEEKVYGIEIPRKDFETGQTPDMYRSILKEAQDDKDSPHHGETGMTPEDWIIASMIHLSETGKPLDDWNKGTEGGSYLTGAFFPSVVSSVPYVFWSYVRHKANIDSASSTNRNHVVGIRTAIII